MLDVRTTWVREFAAALATQADTFGYLPDIRWLGSLAEWEQDETLSDPPLRVVRFPLQRWFRWWPVKRLTGEPRRLAGRLLRRAAEAERDPLVCSAPHYADVAERWPGPVVYYVTDLFTAYAGWSWKWLGDLERRMCSRATVVCANSARIAGYLRAHAGCLPAKVAVVPNGVRADSLLPGPLFHPAPLPADAADLCRPVAGVIGNLGSNTDWDLLREVVGGTPWLSWLFVGPTTDRIAGPLQRRAREDLLHHGGRVRFVGPKPYSELRRYARALDVAVLPYRRREPTYSGSSTRFYEHLPACRPILATRGFEELLHKEPLLRLVDCADGLILALEELRATDFRDGQETSRWRASQTETWSQRAWAMRQRLEPGERGAAPR